MRKITLIAFTVLIQTPSSFAQENDTTASSNTSILKVKLDSLTGTPSITISQLPGKVQPMLVTRNGISFLSYGFTASVTENLIISLESDECDALKKRDRVTLQRLWDRDFTLDQKQGQLVISDNPLPIYLSFGRIIEKVTVIDSNTVFTSGYEFFQQFTTGVNSTPHTTRKYFHTWSKRNGIWKLTTKSTNNQ